MLYQVATTVFFIIVAVSFIYGIDIGLQAIGIEETVR